MTGNNVTGRVVVEEIVIDRSSLVDQDDYLKGSTATLPAAEAALWGRRIGWAAFDDRPVASCIRADNTTNLADTTALTADYF